MRALSCSISEIDLPDEESGFASLGRFGMDIHCIHARTGRTVAQRPLEPLDRLCVSFRRSFDAAVRQVAHPPVHAFAERRRLREISEADALYAAADEEMPRD